MFKKRLHIVQQIEAIEVELTKFNAKRSLSPTEKKLEISTMGNCMVLRDLNSPGNPYYNRIKGFSSKDIGLLEEILRYYGSDSPCLDMTPNHMTEDVAQALSENGFIPKEQLVFMTTQPYQFQGESSVSIQVVDELRAEEFIRWIGLSNGGTLYDQSLVDRVKSYFYAPNFLNYMISVADEPAAMGSLFLSNNAGYIANDFTFEKFRGRGYQLELLKHRLSVAAKLGLETVYTDVEFGSASHGNMEKVGFKTAYINTFWMQK